MNGVLGMAELLEATPMDHEQQEYVSAILNSGELLLVIINDVLDFSKIEAGKLTLSVSCFDLVLFMNRLADMFRRQAKNKKLSFSFHADPNLPQMIEADMVRLRQVLFNLLGNAVKFTSRGEIRLIVSATELPSERILLSCAVEDSGPGIALSLQKEIFAPFTQVGENLHHVRGTGLGLSISKELVELMGGQLLLESPVVEATSASGNNAGSRFSFSIEVKKGHGANTLDGVADWNRDDLAISQGVFAENLSGMNLPSDDVIDALLDAVQSGDIDAMEEQIAKLVSIENSEYTVFSEGMQKLAENFQLNEMEALLENLKKKSIISE